MLKLVVLNQNEKKLQQQMSTYQQRIDNTQKRDVELQSLTRDYEALREKYTSLIGRQEEAKLAGRQKGEQFRVLDPATYPMVVTIPKIAAQKGGVTQRRGQVIFATSLVLVLCVVAGAVRFFAQNNTQLAIKFSSGPASVSK